MRTIRLTHAIGSTIACFVLISGLQARSFAQYMHGPFPAGTAYIIESYLQDSLKNAYVLDDPNAGGSGTQVDLWAPTNTGNQVWLLNNLGGHFDDYYTIESYLTNGSAQPLCLDCSNSATAPGTVVQVWDCNGTWAQNWALQTPGSNGPYVIVPGNAYWMALNAPDAEDGAKLTIESQSGSDNQNWILMEAKTSDLNSIGNWCMNGGQTACEILVAIGAPAAGAVAAIGSVFAMTSVQNVQARAKSLQASAVQVADEDALESDEPSPTIVEAPTGLDVDPNAPGPTATAEVTFAIQEDDEGEPIAIDAQQLINRTVPALKGLSSAQTGGDPGVIEQVGDKLGDGK